MWLAASQNFWEFDHVTKTTQGYFAVFSHPSAEQGWERAGTSVSIRLYNAYSAEHNRDAVWDSFTSIWNASFQSKHLPEVNENAYITGKTYEMGR